jgi:AcrR family transcriptional regulator
MQIAVPISGSPANQSRQQRRVNRTRRKLLDAARSVFADKGFDAATVDDITERADIGKGTFYYHFENRQDLIQTIIKSVLDDLAGQMEEACKDKEELPDILDAMIGAHIDFFSKRWEDFVMYYQGRADMTLNEGYEGIQTPFIDYLKVIEELVDSAISRQIPDPVLRRLACAIAGFISGYYSFAVVTTTGEDVDKTLVSLRSAFVSSLVRFINEALPDTGSESVGLST